MNALNRRRFLKSAAIMPLLAASWSGIRPKIKANVSRTMRRFRPSDPEWPSAASWEQLRQMVGAQLLKPDAPLQICKDGPNGTACADFFKELKNPYFIGDHPSLTQTSGWLDAWTSSPSAYVVAARNTNDVVAAVNFARENNLRLAVKGGGHSYQGIQRP
ncbi:MAG TPA: FAD-binding protein [Candidatus Saccharimonadales bacterium]|nr:FAD-binding protein [Candidatus Saccharimonadales bacterium]